MAGYDRVMELISSDNETSGTEDDIFLPIEQLSRSPSPTDNLFTPAHRDLMDDWLEPLPLLKKRKMTDFLKSTQSTSLEDIYLGSEQRRKGTTSKDKGIMLSPHRMGIFPALPIDDDTVCKEKLISSSTSCIFDTVEYLYCEGLTSHRFTDASQLNCCSTNIPRERIKFQNTYFTFHNARKLRESVKLYRNTFIKHKDEETASRCFGYKLILDLYDEIREHSVFNYCDILYKDIFAILYSMKHIFSLPIYELLRKGCDLNDDSCCFPVSKEAMDITLQCMKRRLLQRQNKPICITKLLFCHFNSKSSVYLLVYYRGKQSGQSLQQNGINVKWKPDAFVNNEAKLVINHKPAFGSKFSPYQLPRVTAEVASQLFKHHSNLSMISASEFKSIGYQRGNHTIKNCVCIQLFCKSKGFIPYGEPIFPTKIDSFDVDVLEGICYFGNDCVQMGTKIGAEGQCKTGAIGGFVDLPQNKTGLITCAHNIYFPSNLINGDMKSNPKVYTQDVFNPSGFEESGSVLISVFNHGNHRQVSVDAALIQINRPISASFPDVPAIQLRKAGFDHKHPPQFNSGEIITAIPNRNQRVIKYGPVSELTCGMLTLDGLHVRMEKEEMAFILPNEQGNYSDALSVTMYGQYGVNNTNEGLFFKAGDSGSFVFMVEENSNHRQTLKCIGMAIGIAKGPGTCIITPIKDVLEALKLEMKLKSFNNLNDNEDNRVISLQSSSMEDILKTLVASNRNLESKLDAELKSRDEIKNEMKNFQVEIKNEMKNSQIEIKNEMKNFKTEVSDSLNAIKEEICDIKGNTASQSTGSTKRKKNSD